jgi:beta-lactamase regulating signal transducer with metallopeptidase domain
MFWVLTADGLHAALAGAGGWFAALARAAAPVAVAAFWQGAAIAAVLGLCLRLTRRFNFAAAQRFAVWAAAFAVVAGLPLLPLPARGIAGAIAASAPLGLATPRAWFQFDERWALAIAALWLAASLVRALGLAVHALRLRRIWNAATPVAADAKIRELLEGASSARRNHHVELCTTRELDRPCVIGFFAPRILIPDWLFARLTPGELEQVVLHEAEHLRRGDDWTNLLQKLALVVFPLNPALAWIEGRLCREREMACDEGVVRRTQAPREYAACLTSLAERGLQRRRAHALSLGAFERRPELVRRVYSILARKQALHPMAARALVGVAGCGLLIASVELARCPQMVAFVPAARTATLETQAAQTTEAAPQGDGDRAFLLPTAARGDSGFHAVETKAILPAGHGDAPAAHASLRRAVALPTEEAGAWERQVASTDAPAPREVLLRAENSDADERPAAPHTSSGFAGHAEYVVLTAWEEVQTSPRNAGIVSDHDTDTTEQPQSGDSENRASRQSDGQRTVRITVTRLIFAVYPVDTQLANPATGTKPAHAKDSGRPAAPLADGGWLVLQL